jgi:hypothetical protein
MRQSRSRGLGWKSEVARSAVKKALPFKPILRRVKRRMLPCAPHLADHRIAVEHGIKLIEMLRACGFDVAGKVGLEIGTGWVPTVPIIHWIAGAERFFLADVVRYLDEQTLGLARQNVELHADLIERRLGIPAHALEKKLSRAKALQDFGFTYLAPVRWQSFDPASVDYVISRAVLEHIPVGEMPGMLSSMSRILKAGGLAAHIIDNSGHFQHSDQSITRLNFLKFSDAKWSFICTLTDQQNRLRHSDYQAIFSSSGLQTIYEERYVDEETLIALGHLQVHPKFRNYHREDLAAITSYFVLQKPA